MISSALVICNQTFGIRSSILVMSGDGFSDLQLTVSEMMLMKYKY